MYYLSFLIGLVFIVFTMKLTQIFKLPSIYLLGGQICGSLIVLLLSNLGINYVNQIALGYLSIPVSLLFLVSFTNVMTIEKEQKPLILLLPCITLVFLSIRALLMDLIFVSTIGVCAVLTIISALLYSYFTGKVQIGRTITTSIGFLIAVLSLSLSSINFYFASLYIPLFTLALPFTLHLFLQKKFTSLQSIMICTLVASIFGLVLFVIPFNIEWYFVIGLTVILTISQLFSKYRFI